MLLEKVLDVLCYVTNYVDVAIDVFFQRMFLRKCLSLERIGPPSLTGRTFIVTGPTSGIGTYTAHEIARRGAKTILACRDATRGNRLAEDIRHRCKHGSGVEADVEVMILDVSSLKSCRDFAKKWKAREGEGSRRNKDGSPVGPYIHGLIHNAGIFDFSLGRKKTSEGYEAHYVTNYLSNYLLTRLLFQELFDASQVHWDAHGGDYIMSSRIVCVSSKMHQVGYVGKLADLQFDRGYAPAAAYSRSKLCQVLFIAELRRKLEDEKYGVEALAVHPGEVMTNVTRSLPAWLIRLKEIMMVPFLLTAAEGARASIAALTCPNVSHRSKEDGTLGYLGSGGDPERPARQARREEDAKLLWKISAAQCDLPEHMTFEVDL
ncbi:retinol dehydrogenase 12 [Pycnococcus provasolii]